MSVIEKSEILSLVAGSGLPRRRALAQLGLPKSTYLYVVSESGPMWAFEVTDTLAATALLAGGSIIVPS